MNQENFEEAYIRANAQLAFVISEGISRTLAKRASKVAKGVSGAVKSLVTRRKPKTGSEPSVPEMSERLRKVIDGTYSRRLGES